ncbi:MAG: hypothetical protein EA393_01700 [Bacteroidetes bacterium]|nr:MAG: hypothetical protein EA393_01700 [Bacteroidota bacterium]
MSKLKTILLMAIVLTMAACNGSTERQKGITDFITEQTISQTLQALTDEHGEIALMERGVRQASALWTSEDGNQEDFKNFCLQHFIAGDNEREKLFQSLSRNFEALWGHTNQISVELNKPLHLDWGPLQPVDLIFAGYSPGAHFSDDFFNNKIAFITILNFPFYSLDEKAENVEQWTRKELAMARLGDIFTSRVPAEVSQEISRISTETDNYVSEYNIRMGKLIDNEGNTLFPDGMSLITHWGLRDEIKSNYGMEGGLPKQEMIYEVMLHIIHQDIPEKVINNPEYQWNPFENKVYSNGQEVDFTPEPDTRYEQLLSNFRAHKNADPYNPNYPTYIERAFNSGLEMSMDEVEELFIELVSSPLLKDVGALVSKRLGRDLKPFDIWYDGFKARSSISEEYLDEKTRRLYPDAQAFEADLPNLLIRMGYSRQRANYISDKIVVEASRGAGHAWGARMRSQVSRLRTRIPETGMDYKGFNIAIHELGHNVEQTISLYDVDFYMMNGVPNTAFTEALAFMYQTRDLELLGIQTDEPDVEYLNTLDKLWGSYEIMGVSLVDMAVWRWMYDNPDATAGELKEETIRIAKEVWNNYFAPVFGIEDSPILAIYSHMIAYPLYLSAYPLGRLIEFQIEQYVKGKNLATESDRMFTAGRLIPQEWMRNAVGMPVSVEPMLEAAKEAVERL